MAMVFVNHELKESIRDHPESVSWQIWICPVFYDIFFTRFVTAAFTGLSKNAGRWWMHNRPGEKTLNYLGVTAATPLPLITPAPPTAFHSSGESTIVGSKKTGFCDLKGGDYLFASTSTGHPHQFSAFDSLIISGVGFLYPK